MEFRELDNLVAYELLKNFALSLIGVFIPVYIVSEGFGLPAAALFLIISGFTGITLSYPVSRIVARIGFKHSLAASYIFLIPGLASIRYFDLSILLIIFSSLMYNLGRLFHNLSMNSEFAVDSEDENRSSDSGKMLSLPNISRIIAPLAGGLIFAGLGFGELMMVTVFILLLSVIPLMRSEDHRDSMDYDLKNLLGKEYLKTVPLFIARGVQANTAVAIFGLFVYMIIGGSIDVGGARALDSLGFVATGLLVGKYASNINKKVFVAIGCTGAAASYLARGLLVTPFQVFVVSFISGIFFQIYHVPIYSSFADEAEKTDILEFYTLRKMFVSVGNVLTVLTLYSFYTLTDLRTGFQASFVLAAFATVGMAWSYWREDLT